MQLKLSNPLIKILQSLFIECYTIYQITETIFANRKIYPVAYPCCNDCVETNKHLLYECQNVKEIWNAFNNKNNFDVSHKRIVAGFYHEMIYQPNIILRNQNIYKMWCRIEEKMNPQINDYVM